MFSVTITHKDTAGTTYDNRTNGALIRAAAAQLSEVKIIEEFEGHCKDSNGNYYDFSTSETNGYCRNTFLQLQKKQIPHIKISLEKNNIR